MQLLIGIFIGIAVVTVGVSGLAKIADRGVEEVQAVIKGVSK